MFIRNSRNKPLPHGRRGELLETTDHHLKNSRHEALTRIIAIIIAILLWRCSHYSRRVAFPFVLFSLSRCCSPSCRCIFFLRFIVFFFAVLLPLLIEISFYSIYSLFMDQHVPAAAICHHRQMLHKASDISLFLSPVTCNNNRK